MSPSFPESISHGELRIHSVNSLNTCYMKGTVGGIAQGQSI